MGQRLHTVPAELNTTPNRESGKNGLNKDDKIVLSVLRGKLGKEEIPGHKNNQ